MKRILSARLAGQLLLAALALLLLFHFLVLLRIIPADAIWGGQIDASSTDLLVLELVAVVVTLIFGAIVAARLNYIGDGKYRGAVRIGVWFVFGYFLLNTVGNFASGVAEENMIFGPVTILLTLLALRLALAK